MFEKFTEGAIKVIMLAQNESRRLGHNFVGTEQILLGLIGESSGIAARLLKQAGVSLNAARIEVEKIIGRGSDIVAVEIPFTPRAKRILEFSVMEASRLHSKAIGTEHLLLGLIKESEGVANRVLESFNVDRIKLRAQIIGYLGGSIDDLNMSLPAEPKFSIIPSDTANLAQEPFNWYSSDAILLVQRAWGIAETLGSNEIGVEHLFLAALRDDLAVLPALQSAGLTLGKIREHIFKSLKPGDTKPAKSLPFSQEAQKILEDAWHEGVEQKQCAVTKECIMLSILRQGSGVAFDVMKELGADVPKVRQSLTESLKETAKKIQEENIATAQAALEEAKRTPLPHVSAVTRPLMAQPIFAISWFVGMMLLSFLLGSTLFSGSANSAFFWMGLIAMIVWGYTYRAQQGNNSAIKRLKTFPLYTPFIAGLLIWLITGGLAILLSVGVIQTAFSFQILLPILIVPLVTALVLILILMILFPCFTAIGESMKPAILSGDAVIGERIAKLMHSNFKRGDIISFRATKDMLEFIPQSVYESIAEFSLVHWIMLPMTGFYLSKRIVGLPGEQIEIKEGQLYIDNKPINQPWATGLKCELTKLRDIGYMECHPFPDKDEPIVVPANYYFVLGDHHTITNVDSHIFGFVDYKSIRERWKWIIWRDGKFYFSRL